MESCLGGEMQMKRLPGGNERGTSILEFAVVAPCLVLLFFGSIGTALMLGRYIQAVQVCRDVNHMYVDGVDFTKAASQNIVIQKLASGVGMTATGGNGVVVLSRIITVYQADCDAAGYSASCNNLNTAVFAQRITFGNSTLRRSDFGTPTASLMDTQGNINSRAYLTNTDSTVRTSGFTGLLTAVGQTQQQGDSAWVAEIYFSYPDLSYLGSSTTGGAYARFIF
jgi:Flp pilus assembly protein TadG